jgi:AhpD family alkylhydroperoxidase
MSVAGRTRRSWFPNDVRLTAPAELCWWRIEPTLERAIQDLTGNPLLLDSQGTRIVTGVAKEKEMSEHYHDVGDLRFLKEMGKLAPAEFQAWFNLDSIVARENGAIPRKFRELIALGVAFTTQCPYCIEVHTKAAKKAGASREEITEAALIAAALRAGGAATHGAMALKFYDQP